MGLKLHPDIQAEIIQHYSQRHGAPADLIELSSRLGIPKPDICSVAGSVGLTDKHRPKPNPQLRGSNNPRWIPDQELRHDDSGRLRVNSWGKRRLFHAKAGAKGGKRADLGGVFFRSRWEANYARALNALKARGEIVDWFYEDREFEFKGIKRGTRFYKPDFRVVEADREYFVEVKGVLDSKSVTALTRMGKYYPDVTVLLLDSKKYAEIESEFGDLEHWERK